MLRFVLMMALICSNVFADLANNEIVANSVIKASDINLKLEQVRSAIQSKGNMVVPEFSTINVGDSVSKASILNELYKIQELYPLGTELSLTSEITSTNINSVFGTVLSQINNYSVITYQTVDTTPSCASLNLQVCGGTQNISKTYTCEQYIDGVKNEAYIPNQNNCQPLLDMSDIVCQSIAGQMIVNILNGTQNVSCLQGSTEQSIVSTTCNSGYRQQDNECVAIVVTHEPSYSDYGSCSINESVACSGTGSKSRSITSCQRLEDGVPVPGGQLSDCSSFETSENLSISCYSISGNYLEEILGGNLSYNCGAGVSANDITPLVLCDSGFTADQLNLLCEENIAPPESKFRFGANGFINSVYSITELSDGKLLVGGNIITYNGTVRNRIAKLNADGSLDETWNTQGTGFNGTIESITELSDGKLLVGGQFTSYNGTPRNYIAKLNADGSLDETWNTQGTGLNGAVNSITELSDGKFLVGGAFAGYSGTGRRGIAKLNANGTLDTTWNTQGTGFNRTIYSITELSDGKLLVGGDFTSYNGTPRKYIAKLNANGTLDTSWNTQGTGFSEYVYSLTGLSDGKILVGGFFTDYNGTARNRIAKLNADGSLDESWNTQGTGFVGYVYSITELIDGKILVGGSISSYNGTARNNIAKLNADGSLNTSWKTQGTGFSGTVYSITELSDGKILVGGRFTSYNGTARNRIAKLNADGSLNTSWNTQGTGFNGDIYSTIIHSITKLSDGKFLVGGDFEGYNGTARKYIAKLNANGTLDTSWNTQGTGFNGPIYSITELIDGKLLVGGQFSSYNGTARNRIAKLNADGSLDESWNTQGTGFNYTVWASAELSDGKILVGGWFSNYNGTARKYIAKLNADGSLDESWDTQGTGFNSFVNSITELSDGKLLVGGNFANYNGTARKYIAKLNADGSLDETWNTQGTGFTSIVYSITELSDGKILVGGDFSMYNGGGYGKIIKLESDGSMEIID